MSLNVVRLDMDYFISSGLITPSIAYKIFHIPAVN